MQDLTILLAPLVASVLFIAHGGQKFLQGGTEDTSTSFAQTGIPLPDLAA